MPTIVSQLTEITTTLKLKVACKKLGSDDHPSAEVKTNLEFGNWGFLKTIPKESVEKESLYTHPFARKSSFSRLSEKSLELCTESLGSESGTDVITDGSTIFSSSDSSDSSDRDELEISKQRTKSTRNTHVVEANSCRKIKNFPPPLTTMSGSSSLQVRRHREGGRLIIEAVEAPFRNSYLQAERSDGRLRLCFLTGSDTAETTTSTIGEQEEEEEEEEEENGVECGGETAAAEEIDEPRNEAESEKEEIDGEINMEVGMEKFQRLRRCNDGRHENNGFYYKPALWVATS